MIRGTVRLEDPDSMEATVSITMTIKQWKEVRDQTSDVQMHPTSILRHIIWSVISKAEQGFGEAEEVSP